jgi:PAS domain S-box-containing protein
VRATNLFALTAGIALIALAYSLTRRELHTARRARDQVFAERERFRVTLASIGDAVITTDPAGRVTFLNATAAALTGWPPDEAAGRPLAEVFNIANQDGCSPGHNPAERALREGVVVGLANHTILTARDGTERPIADSAAPICDRHGEAAGVVLVFRDVTDARRAELALRQKADELSESHRRKDEFLAMLAHELRNPLAPIRNAAQLLHLAGPTDPDQRWALDVIDRQSGHLARLVDDLLDVARITRGKIRVRKQRVSVRSVVDTAIETSRPQIEAAGHTLTVTMPEATPTLDADPTRLAQVLANLLNNAAKYTPRGGMIGIEVTPEGERVRVSVSDNGIGIPAALLPRIFDAFTQASQALDRAQGGLGVGLTLARRLVELHGGTLEALSDGPGHGSTFTVTLPIVEGEPNAQTKPEETPAAFTGFDSDFRMPRTVPRKVMVVEDNADAAKSLGLLLRHVGCEVRICPDGPTALEAAPVFRPDVVLCDIGLPGIDGYEVARRLREQAENRGATLVAITGWGQDEDRRLALEAGFDRHLVKPIDPSALRDLLAGKAAPRDGTPNESSRPA